MLKYDKLTTEYLSPIGGDNSDSVSGTSVPDVVEDTRNKGEKALEDISIFGDNLTGEEKKMIKSWPENFRKNMKGILTFQETTTTILVNKKELVFDKKKLIKGEMYWERALNLAEDNNQRILDEEEFKELFKIIGPKELSNILHIKWGRYWTSDYFYGNGYVPVAFIPEGLTGALWKTAVCQTLTVHKN